MSYEKELAELRKNWKKSTDKYEEAIEYGFVVDAAMRSHDVMEIERQIYVYEQATKADEYEAKAKAFDELQSQLKEGKPYDDVYMGWVSYQSYKDALRQVLELSNKLKDKYEDNLDDGW